MIGRPHPAERPAKGKVFVIIGANRGWLPDGTSGGGGLQAALVAAVLRFLGDAEPTAGNIARACWVAVQERADIDEATWRQGTGVTAVTGRIGTVGPNGLRQEFVQLPATLYQKYYALVANVLLWFTQHELPLTRNYNSSPEIREAWIGNREANRAIANRIIEEIDRVPAGSIPVVMLQDYHPR